MFCDTINIYLTLVLFTIYNYREYAYVYKHKI